MKKALFYIVSFVFVFSFMNSVSADSNTNVFESYPIINTETGEEHWEHVTPGETLSLDQNVDYVISFDGPKSFRFTDVGFSTSTSLNMKVFSNDVLLFNSNPQINITRNNTMFYDVTRIEIRKTTSFNRTLSNLDSIPLERVNPQYETGYLFGKNLRTNNNQFPHIQLATDGNLGTTNYLRNFDYISTDNLIVDLNYPINVDSYFIEYDQTLPDRNTVLLRFFDVENKLIYETEGENGYNDTPILNNVKHIEVLGVKSDNYHDEDSTFNISGLDLYGSDLETYQDVIINEIETFYNRIYLEWENPDDEDFKKILVYKNDSLIEEVEAPLNYRYINNLEPNTEYTFILKTFYDPPGEESRGVTFTVTTKKIEKPTIKETDIFNYHSARINFTRPTFNGSEKVQLFQDGEMIAETTGSHFYLEGLEPEEVYSFELKTVTTEGFISEGEQVIFETLEAPLLEEITDLTAESTYNRVDLSWNNPSFNPHFNFVRIYRQDIQSTEDDNIITSLLFGSRVSANEEEYTPIFETNGTQFNDLTVAPESDYEYKLTTTNTEGEESEGVYIFTSTDTEPEPTMGGVNDSVDENGNYVYSWSTPTSGEVQVIVGGEEYATVDASLGSITIPESEMKYTALGDPAVTLVPISQYGTVGENHNPSKVLGAGLPFSVAAVVTGSMEIIGLVTGFIVLALALIFAPRIIAFIKKSIRSQNTRRVRT
ncbi:hypothetical protein QA612_09750 [Evansella sp. AB-P1]|uniref:hypothetical protein n=1 Tax=Evansella sp. AB-P1 TaxID=3037653 RepID=UPI00241E19F0|nr:hypothetical protein [Evansella sp. AB-P1]MDG5787783.1 hypothetical protein [Evansella sp. AB-P1]